MIVFLKWPSVKMSLTPLPCKNTKTVIVVQCVHCPLGGAKIVFVFIFSPGTDQIKSNQITSNQITFIVTPQHKCLGE